eukprot:jgi/Botrbrau1/16157/Bobra.0309s0006.1
MSRAEALDCDDDVNEQGYENWNPASGYQLLAEALGRRTPSNPPRKRSKIESPSLKAKSAAGFQSLGRKLGNGIPDKPVENGLSPSSEGTAAQGKVVQGGVSKSGREARRASQGKAASARQQKQCGGRVRGGRCCRSAKCMAED